jgi:glycine cleavage system aminomethyltransferase T
MASYEIKEVYPCTEEGFVYADVIVNDETEPRRLIIPEATENAQTILADYVTAEENAATPTPPVVDAEVTELIDTPVEV